MTFFEIMGIAAGAGFLGYLPFAIRHVLRGDK